MNKIFSLFIYSLISISCADHADNTLSPPSEINEQASLVPMSELKVPFSKMGFIEPLENSTYARKTDRGIQNWNNGETVIKFFINVASQPLPNDTLRMEVEGQAYENAQLEVRVNDIKVGELDVKAGSFKLSLPYFIPKTSNYQCVSFRGLNGNIHYPDLENMYIKHRKGLDLNYNTSNYGAAAVHLSYALDNKNNIEWSLGEVMIKPEACRPDMYYMVSSFDGGYSGIQVSADLDLANPKGNTFLFSVWSDYNTQDPSEIPDDYQPWTDAIRQGDDMRDEGFGNEGSGVHANWYYKWNPNTVYKVLIRQENLGTVRRNGKDYPNCKAYTCWLYVPEQGGWVFFVRYIRPNDNRTTLGVPGSFVENPSGTHSSSKYRGYYRHWVRYRGQSQWVSLTDANFTTTGANELHPRFDMGIGHENINDQNGYGGEFFYIFSGGFTVNTGRNNIKDNRSSNAGTPDVDLTNLPALTTFDNLMNGDTREGQDFLNQTAWTVTASSEERTATYEYSYATYAIDNDPSTFWSTQYIGQTPDFPHWIMIDLSKSETSNGISIQPRGRDVTKDFRIEVSTNKQDWKLVGNYRLQNNGNVQKFTFPTTQTARYIKMTCLNGYDNNKITSIKEIKLFRNK